MSSSIHHELSYERDIESVTRVSFGVLSPDEVLRTSVAEVTKTDTYQNGRPVLNGLFDPRMGVLDQHDRCQTCGQTPLFCPGHFGHVVLTKPVYHVHFFPMVKKILRCVCHACSALLIDEATALESASVKWSRAKRWDVLSKRCAKVNVCPACEAVQPEKVVASTVMNRVALSFKRTSERPAHSKELTAEDVMYLFRKVSDRDVDLLGLSSRHGRPDWMVCSVLPVPPPAIRPSVRMDNGQRSEDDLTHKLCDIVKANAVLRSKLASEAPKPEDVATCVDLLQYHVATLVENKITGAIPAAQQRSGRTLETIANRIEGKNGRFRGNLLGKRVDFSARGVITPDPCISIDELGVPLVVATNLTFPEVVHSGNLDRLRRAVLAGPDVHPGAKFVQQGRFTRTLRTMTDDQRREIHLVPGDVVHRHMIDGDAVLFNRQPSLHKYSMMCHRVKVMPGKTFRLNVCVCNPYNSDFDGDEMNLHMPQSLTTQHEIEALAAVSKLIVGTANCKPLIGVVQDVALGVYRLTKPGVVVPAHVAADLLSALRVSADRLTIAPSSGADLFSAILPAGVNYGRPGSETAFIRDGTLVEGAVSKRVYQTRSTGLVHAIFNDLGPDETRRLFDNTQRLVCDWLATAGFSVGLSDVTVSDDDERRIQEIVQEQFAKVADHQERYRSGADPTYDAVAFERDVNGALNGVVAAVQETLAGGVRRDNRVRDMIESGSKGSYVNMVQMMGCVGQQNVDGKRVPYGFDGRTLPHYCKYDDGPESRGFVRSSFARGLTPQEFFFHAMGGREGLIDTAVRTADIGYAQRKLVKAMEDLRVAHDRSVRNASGGLVQFRYGEDAMDGSKIESQKLPTTPLIMERLAAMGGGAPETWQEPAAKVRAQYEFANDEDDEERVRAHLKSVLEEDPAFVARMFKDKPAQEPELLYPIAFERVLRRYVDDDGEPATVSDVLDAIDGLCRRLVVGPEEEDDPTKKRHVLGVLVRAFLSPSYLMNVRGVRSKAALASVVAEIERKFFDAIVQPSEMVGVIAAQSIGEPATQCSMVSGTQIIVRCPDGSIFKGPVGELVDAILARRRERIVNFGNDSLVLPMMEDDYRIIGVSNDEKTSWRRISEVSRHPANGGLVRVHTRSGKSTTATLSHSFLKRTVDGIAPVLGSDLKVGDRLPVAKRIPMMEADDIIHDIDLGRGTLMRLDREFGWFCGAYLADGRATGRQVDICNSNPAFFGRVVDFAEGLGCSVRQWMNAFNGQNNRFTHDELSKFLAREFGCGSHKKRVPGFVFKAPREFVAGLLCSYFSGDGSVNDIPGKQMIRSASVSKRLSEDVIQLLSFFGIFASLSVEHVTKLKSDGVTKQADLYCPQISRKYARAFREQIGLVVPHKAAALDNVIAYVERENARSHQEEIDKIPELGEVIARVGGALGYPQQSRIFKRWIHKSAIGRRTLEAYVALFERTADALVDSEDLVAVLEDADAATEAKADAVRALDARLGYETEKDPVGPRRVAHYVKRMRKAADQLPQVRQDIAILRQAAYGDVVWDEIVRLEHLPDPKEHVYDFTVPGNDSFLVDCNVLVHNTLNSFHSSGLASASKAVRGVPRLKELLSATKNMKAPSMTIRGSSDAKRILQALYLKDLVESSTVFYERTFDRNPFDDDLLAAILAPDDLSDRDQPPPPPPPPSSRRGSSKTKTDDAPPPVDIPWRVYLDIDRLKLASRRLTLQHVRSAIEAFYRPENVSVKTADENDAEHPIVEVRMIGALTPADPEDAYLHYRAFEASMLENVLVHGIPSLIKVSALNESATLFDTDGSNLPEVLARHREDVDDSLNDADHHHVVSGDVTVTNDVYEILRVLGVEAARQALLDEIGAVLDDASATINARHLTMLADAMTARGALMPVDRHGINRVDIGPLAKSSFEETKDMLVHASVFAEIDPVTGVSANTMLGQLPPCGTGDGDILIDEANLPRGPAPEVASTREEAESEVASTGKRKKKPGYAFEWTLADLLEQLERSQ